MESNVVSITVLEGADLAYLCDLMQMQMVGRPSKVRIYRPADSARVKIKVDEGMWTPFIGKQEVS